MSLFQSSFAPLLTFKNYAGEEHTEQLPWALGFKHLLRSYNSVLPTTEDLSPERKYRSLISSYDVFLMVLKLKHWVVHSWLP